MVNANSSPRLVRCIALSVGILSVCAVRGSNAAAAESGIAGDWRVTVTVERDGDDAAPAQTRTAILEFTTDELGKHTGFWIGRRGLVELAEVTLDAGRLAFAAEVPAGEAGVSRWTFRGTVDADTLSGRVSGDRGDFPVEGRRIVPLPDVAGHYAFSYTENDVSLSLAVRVDDEGQLTAAWRSADGEVPVTDLKYDDGALTFDSPRGSYRGRLTARGALNGTYSTNGRDYSVLASRMGESIIGTWHLELTAGDRVWRQRFKVRRDMSGWLGAVPISDVTWSNDLQALRRRAPGPTAVTFKTVRAVGADQVETAFGGIVVDATLTGKLTSGGREVSVSGTRAVPLPPAP